VALKLIDVQFETSPKAHYISKVRVVVQAEVTVTAWSPQWRTGANGGVHVQHPFGSGLECRAGAGWAGKTLAQVTLSPGDQIRAWVGLDASVPETRLRTMRGGVGTLVIPLTNEHSEWSEATFQV
jgi:hypothetical protein